MEHAESLEPLQEAIEYTFQDPTILLEAVTHRSYLNERSNHPVDHNERMEFLGDAVLELIVTEYLFHEYPDQPEGQLTNYRSALVKGEHLAQVAERFDLVSYLLMSRGEASDPNSRAYITANAIEALIAALYLDGSLEVARGFVERFILPDLSRIIEQKLFIDAKSMLQETMQEEEQATPVYEVTQEWGPDHDKRFEVTVSVSGEHIATGVGGSKQRAEQEAARHALQVKDIS
jgi:ribonuclease-3